jgi:hypothetical protein
MSPRFWESKAAQIYPYRWWLGGVSVLAFIAMAASGFAGNRTVLVATVVVALPVMVVAWGLLCASSWFEPSRGTLSGNSWLGRHAAALNALARWWAAIFLPLFIAAGILAPIWWATNVAKAA